MNTSSTSNRLRALLGALLLLTIGARTLTAGEPYAQWAVAAGTLAGLTPAGEILSRTGDAILKSNQQGQLVTSNAFTGYSIDHLVTDSQGNQYWTGRVYAEGAFQDSRVRGFFVAKWSPANTLLWVRNNGSAEDGNNTLTEGQCLAVDVQGNVAVGGSTRGPLTLGSFAADGEESPFFCKYDAAGNLLWARKVQCQFAGSVGGGCYDIRLDSLGNLVVCGFLRESIADFGGTIVYPGTVHGYGGDWFLAKYSPNGDLLWVTLDYGRSFAMDQQGNIYATFGWPKQGDIQGLAMLNGNGDLLWEKRFPALTGNRGVMMAITGGTIAVDELGRPVFCGLVRGTVQLDAITLTARASTDFFDFFVGKADVDGNILWAISGGSSGQDYPGPIICGPDGTVFLSVSNYSGGEVQFDGISLSAQDILIKLTERPMLTFSRLGNSLQLSWPSKATDHVLESAATLPPVSWDVVALPTIIDGRERRVQLPPTGNAGFFRLHQN